ncbi:hypothetical protein LMG5911_03294 [Achromobacter spanius]|nr:hypothetical protein LMG5911_03294 [Achromobacter spanius]
MSSTALVSDTAPICVQFVPLLVEYHQVPWVVSAPTMAIPVSGLASMSDVEPMKLLTEVPTAPVGAGAGTLAFKSSLIVDRVRVAAFSTGASLTAVTVTATVSEAIETAPVIVVGLTLVPAVPTLWSQPRSVSALPALPLKLPLDWK